MATFLGTNGNDTIQPSGLSAGVFASPVGALPSVAADLLDGDDGNDFLNGGGGLDTLLGGQGNDTILAGGGTGLADGGDGDDQFIVFGATAITTLTGGLGTDIFVQAGAIDISTGSVSGFEQLSLTGPTVTLTAAQLNGFGTVAANPGSTTGALSIAAPGSATVNLLGLTALSVTGSAGADQLVFLTPGAAQTAITVNAGAGNDTIYGAGGNDTLNGGSDNDFLSGRGGLDLLNGGDGNDTLALFSVDTVQGAAGDDIFVASEGTLAAGTEIQGGSGTDTLITVVAALIDPTVIINSVETLAMSGPNLTMTVKQLDGFTTITNDAGSAAAGLTLTAGASPSTFASTTVGQLADLGVTGSGVDDTLIFISAAAGPLTRITLDGAVGNDSLRTGAGADTVNGGIGNDSIDAGAGADVLFGGDGNDVLFIRDQDDAFGQGGNDRLELLENATVGKVFNGGAGDDTLGATGTRTIAADVVIQEIENLAVDTSTLSLTTAQLGTFSTIIGDAGALQGTILLTAGGTASLAVGALVDLKIGGSAGNDVLTLASGVGTRLIVDGSGGDDLLTGGAGGDDLSGGIGNDTIIGAGGADTLRGDAGNDVIRVGTGDDADGGADNDLFLAFENLSSGTEILGGTGSGDRLALEGPVTIDASVNILGVEELALDGTGVTIAAQALNAFDRIVASGGATDASLTLGTGGPVSIEVQGLASLAITGSATQDLLNLNNPGATAITAALGLGADSIAAGARNDTLAGEDGNDTLSGVGGDDSLAGGQGVDLLLGGNGADILNGGSETDTLVGGAGRDRLTGGSAADFFRWDLPSEGQDTVRDFTAALGDKLQFDASGFGGGLVGGVPLAAGQLVVHASNQSTSPTGTGQFVFNTGTSILLWDADGSGGATGIKIAKLQGVTTLSTGDFDIIA